MKLEKCARMVSNYYKTDEHEFSWAGCSRNRFSVCYYYFSMRADSNSNKVECLIVRPLQNWLLEVQQHLEDSAVFCAAYRFDCHSEETWLIAEDDYCGF